MRRRKPRPRWRRGWRRTNGPIGPSPRTRRIGTIEVHTPGDPYLIRLDILLARDRSPYPHLFADELAQLLGSGQQQGNLLRFGELLGDAILPDAGGDVGAEAADDRRGRGRRREYAPPRIGLESGKAALAHRRHGAQRWRTRLAGLHHRPDGAGLNLWNGKGGAADEEVDVAGDGVVHGRATAAIGHVDELGAGLLGQQGHGEVTDAAAADRGIADRARLGLRRRDHVVERLERLLRLRRYHV